MAGMNAFLKYLNPLPQPLSRGKPSCPQGNAPLPLARLRERVPRQGRERVRARGDKRVRLAMRCLPSPIDGRGGGGEGKAVHHA